MNKQSGLLMVKTHTLKCATKVGASFLSFKKLFLFILIVSCYTATFAATKTWQIAGGGIWTTPANWSGGTIPQPGDDIVINLTTAGTISAVPSLTVNSISIGGTQNPILTGTSGTTLTLNNTNATAALSIIAARTLTLGAGTAPTALNLTFQNINTPDLISGTLTASANTTINLGMNQTLTITGTLSAAGSFIANNTGSTVIYNGAGAQTIVPVTYNNLSTAGGGTKTLAGNNTINGNLTIGAGTTLLLGTVAATLNISGNAIIDGTLDFGTTIAKTINLTGDLIDVSGTITMSGAALAHNLNLSGANNAITTLTTTAASGSKINYTRSGNQQVFGSINYQNLIISAGGIKTLQSAATINGTLSLTSGILQLGNNNLKVASTTGISSVSGVFDATRMIETDGLGYLIVSSNTNNNAFNGTYPVGNNNYYEPLIISGLASTSNAVRSFYIRSVPNNPGIYGNGINKYWDLTGTTANITVGAGTLSFLYNMGDVAVNQTILQPYNNTSGSWVLATGASAGGINPMTSTGSVTLSGLWTAGSSNTYYSYQSGAWDQSSTWTSDPGGTTQVGTTIPGNYDKVVILPSRTVSLPSNIVNNNLDINIEEDGILDMSTFAFVNPLTSLSGQGLLRLSLSNFPVAVSNTFANAGGGTTEYYGNVNINLPLATYNNLTINTSATAIQVGNIILNGNLYVQKGTFQINDNTSRLLSLTINGKVTVDAGAAIKVGNGVTNTTTDPTSVSAGGLGPFINYYDTQSHRVVIKGDLINNGTVRFTNLNFPVYNAFPPVVMDVTSGFASVYFQGLSNNVLTCNGLTDFYNLIVDKGTDQSYKLTVYASAYNNFRLFGANNASFDITNPVTTFANPNLKKALWIRNGSFVLTGMTVIPSLSEGTTAGPPSSDYFIPANGALILKSIDAIVLSTADDYGEINAAYGTAGGTGLVNGVGVGGNSALSVLGKLQIDKGYLSTRESAGLIYWSYASGQFIMNGGTFDSKQICDATGGSTGLMTYIQNGGNVFLRGRLQHNLLFSSVSDLVNNSLNINRNIAGTNAAVGTFGLNNNAANGFTMTGGNIFIYDVCGTVAPTTAFQVNSPSSNINVTGGNVNIIPTNGAVLGDAPNFLINTTAPIGNLSINNGSGCSSIVQLKTYPLIVLQNITLQSGTLDANSLNVTLGGDFRIEAGTTYLPGTNTTTFNGKNDQTFTVNLTAALNLNKLTLDKPVGVAVNFGGSQKTININDNFRLVSGIVNDNGNTLNVSKDIFNSGVHMGTGKILLNGTGLQSIDGNGIFSNLELNNTNAAAAPVSLAANATINGVLTFSQDKLFNVGTYNLNLTASASIVSSSGSFNARYIKTSGNSGDGGLTKVYNAPGTFIFPVGVVNYTPGTLSLNGTPTSYGSITVVPVNYAHPNVKTSGRSLSYFWRVKSSGLVLGSATVTTGFTYANANVISNGTDITVAGYVAACYNSGSYSWTKGTPNDVDEVNNIIGEPGTGNFLENVSFIDGDYTAGDDTPIDPFGLPTRFYSIANGNWNVNTTWSYTSGGAAVPAGAVAGVNFPGPNSVVIIEGAKTVKLTANQNCASLQIASGSVLDIYTWTGSVFSIVLNHPSGNNGLFRLTTTVGSPKVFSFPAGDFSDFNVNHGTTEFYDIDGATGAEYILPPGVTSYGNLILTAKGGDNLILPNNAATTIYGDLTCTGDNPNAWVTMSWLTAGVYNTVEKTVHITGNLFINNGTFLFLDDQTPQHLVVDGNVTIAPTAIFDTYNNYPVNNGAALRLNSFDVGGDFINNSNVNPSARFINGNNYVNLTFFGNTNASLTSSVGAVPFTILNKVTINKGSSQATSLTCNIGGTLSTPQDNWLTLQNGTFRYMRTDPNADFTVSTVTPFTIPASAGLYIDYSNANNKNILIANNNSNVNDLFLNGKLTLVNGKVYVGPIGAPAFNNDIEYSNGGSSEIEVRNGSLVVNGQIRRNPSDASGILKYTQSGGSVTINGNNAIANNNNAKLEVLNSGSSFNMSNNAILTIIKGGGATYGDLYLRPQTSVVTGGTIVFNSNATAAQTYLLDANVGLNNITVTGSAGKVATLKLMVSPLVVNGDFTLTNVSSILDATNGSNSINVTFNGNLANGGGITSYIYGTNLTTFSAKPTLPYLGNQSITGLTNFYNLSVNAAASLTVNNNIVVNGNITTSGTGLTQMGGNTISVKGNASINASYDCNAISGGLILNGILKQHISGNGIFGRLELNNPAGATLDNGITLQKNLKLSNGILDINQYLLTLGQNSVIEGAGFGPSKMISSDGVFSNIGIQKYFASGASPTFTYPMGIAGKYTPADITISANNSVGSVRVNTVNYRHPASLPPYRILKYFWEMESNGISAFSGNLNLTYSPLDVMLTGADEANYVAASLIAPDQWSKAATGAATDNVNEITHQISYSFGGVNSISGEYTAGTDMDIPATVPAYVSNADGDWTNNSIWTPVGSAPPCPAGGPNGYIVTVNHVVTAKQNCFAYRTTINNKLKIDAPYPLVKPNLGTVNGSGTLYMEDGVLPTGRFTSFFNCSNGGILEYGGTSNYTLEADRLDTVPSIIFSGTGTRVLSDKALTVCKQLKIDGPLLDNSGNNSKLTIEGTFERYNTGAFKAGTNAGAIVSFAGTTPQILGGVLGDFVGANAFNNLEINNASGLTLNNNGHVDINNNLLLTNGIITTNATDKLTLTSTSVNCVFPVGGTATSFVDGPLVKKLNPSDGEFIFPIGKGVNPGNKIRLTSTSAGPMLWTAEYFTPNPTYTAFNPPLSAIGSKEYWTVKPELPCQAYVEIIWDPLSDITPLMTQNGIADMRIAEFVGSKWTEIASTASGDNYNGSVSTASRVNVSPSGGSYVIASVNSIKPKARLAPTGPVCGIASGIPISFTYSGSVPLNYTLTYTIDNVVQPSVTITALPYILPIPVTGAYQLTGFMYNNGLSSGVVDIGIITVYAIPTTANAGIDQSQCGATSTTLTANTAIIGTGLWSIVTGAGGTLVAPTNPLSAFNGANGASYTLRWTISNGGCKSADDVIINYTLLPSAPTAVATQNFCTGSRVSDLVASASFGSTIYWYALPSGGSSIAPGTMLMNGDYYAETSNGCVSLSRTKVTVAVDPLSVGGSVSGGTTICSGSVSGLLTLSGYTGTIAKWQFSTDGGASWGDISNTAATYTSGSLIQTTQFRAVVVSGMCSAVNSFPVSVTVNPTSVGGTVSGGTTICSGNTSALLSLSGNTGSVTRWESSIDGGTTWINIANTTTTYTSPILTQTTQFRAVVTSGVCPAGNATSTTVTVTPLPNTGPVYHKLN